MVAATSQRQMVPFSPVSWTRRALRRILHLIPMQLWWAVLVPIALLSIGTIGYPLIEGEPWSHFDGFYMTAITLTTIGYGELYPLSMAGRLFTVALAYGGIFTLAYFMTELVRSVLTGELRNLLGKSRMIEELSRLSQHIIVCGHGRMGKIVCEELERQQSPFVVIDIAPMPAAEEWRYRHGVYLHGNATEDEILRQAGIERASALITTVGTDSENLYITLSARLLNPKLIIVARAEEEPAESKLRKVGANKVISPYLAGGHRAVQAVLQPAVFQFLHAKKAPHLEGMQIEEIFVRAGSTLVGQTLGGARLRQQLGIVILGIVEKDGQALYNPDGTAEIPVEATLIALGPTQKLRELHRLARGD